MNLLTRFMLAGLCILWMHSSAATSRTYEVLYQAQLAPATGEIAVTIRMSGTKLPRQLVFKIDPQRHLHFHGDGKLQAERNSVTWLPNAPLSTLHYSFKVNHSRSNGQYDALLTGDWAIFRGEDLVPPCTVTAIKTLTADTTLEFTLPPDWSAATAYTKHGERIHIANPGRHFQRPEGWMIVGKIGVRSERITGIETVVAAPVKDQARRQDMLALLNWSLPHLVEIFPEFPQRILIVSAGDPMWHGGLSGPASLFIHASRPLISENRTSTLLHELTHLALGIHGDEESDWIVEGLAEYYSIELLRRSGSISADRYQEAMARLTHWGQRAPNLFVRHSSGATTARAVHVFAQAQAEIQAATHNRKSLDDVARQLAAEHGEVTLQKLQTIAAQVAGSPLRTLNRARLESEDELH